MWYRLSPKQCLGHWSTNIIHSHRGQQTPTFLLNLPCTWLSQAKSSSGSTPGDSLPDPSLLQTSEQFETFYQLPQRSMKASVQSQPASQNHQGPNCNQMLSSTNKHSQTNHRRQQSVGAQQALGRRAWELRVLHVTSLVPPQKSIPSAQFISHSFAKMCELASSSVRSVGLARNLQ